MGKELEFRVWDASVGAYPDFTILYSSNAIIGSSIDHVELRVNTARARYIPLNQGWTWFSLSSMEVDMSINHALRSLSPHNGDKIKTKSTESEYVNGSWTGTYAPINSLDTESGYLINLKTADTLRITGFDAPAANKTLSSTWNLIGYPLQSNRALDSTLSILGGSSFSDGDLIKSQDQVADYNTATGWSGSLTQMEVYNAYKLKLDSPSVILDYQQKMQQDMPTQYLGSSYADTLCWEIEPGEHEFDLTITGVIQINEVESLNEDDLVVVYSKGECRGIGRLDYVPEEPLHAQDVRIQQQSGRHAQLYAL